MVALYGQQNREGGPETGGCRLDPSVKQREGRVESPAITERRPRKSLEAEAQLPREEKSRTNRTASVRDMEYSTTQTPQKPSEHSSDTSSR